MNFYDVVGHFMGLAVVKLSSRDQNGAGSLIPQEVWVRRRGAKIILAVVEKV